MIIYYRRDIVSWEREEKIWGTNMFLYAKKGWQINSYGNTEAFRADIFVLVFHYYEMVMCKNRVFELREVQTNEKQEREREGEIEIKRITLLTFRKN